VRQEEDAKFEAEHKKHVEMLREQDDQDEIQDEYSQQKGLFEEDG
jgi:hypothetical protein